MPHPNHAPPYPFDLSPRVLFSLAWLGITLPEMRVLGLLSVAMLAVGCARPKPLTTVSGIPCTIVERVCHDGWRTYGEVRVTSSGYYSWVVTNLWSNPPQGRTFTGKVPTSISKQLFASSNSFDLRSGVRVYEVGIDDTKTLHPAGVDALRDYLYRTHCF
jgi:hypothetical protein